jgi:putative DNA primase/helicase
MALRGFIADDILAVRRDELGMWVEARDWLFAAPRLTHVLSSASAHPAVHVRADDLDRDPWLWNAKNCVVDLRSGDVRAHDPRLLMTLQSPIEHDPEATCPTFDRFIIEVLPKEAVRRYVQRVLGMAMIAEVREHVFPVFKGSGRNGKGALIRIVRRIFGPYACGIAKNLLIETKFEEHSTIIATLFRRRLATTEELSNRQRWNISSIKELTGGDNLQARRMREDEFTFPPSHTLVLSTNARPAIPDGVEGAEAFWARYREIPFDVTIEKPDPTVEDRIGEELSGVLNWLLAGLRGYLDNGLAEPVEVTLATAAPKVAGDAYHRFAQEELLIVDDETSTVTNAKMFELWSSWCSRQVPRLPPGPVNYFPRKLCAASTLKAPEKIGKSNTRTWVGVRIASAEDDAADEGAAGDGATGVGDRCDRFGEPQPTSVADSFPQVSGGEATGATGATDVSGGYAYAGEKYDDTPHAKRSPTGEIHEKDRSRRSLRSSRPL